MLDQFGSLSRRALVLIFGLALVVPVSITIWRIYVVQVEPQNPSCDDLTVALEAQDGVAGLPDTPVLILGNAFTRHWRKVPDTLAGHEVLLRTERGLDLARAANCFQRTVAFYRPKVTVIFLSIEHVLTSPLETFSDLNRFDEERNYYGVSPLLAIVPPATTPASADAAQALSAFSNQIALWATEHSGAVVIELDPAFKAGPVGVDATLFWPDGRTPTERGYQAMTEQIRATLEPILTSKSPLT